MEKNRSQLGILADFAVGFRLDQAPGRVLDAARYCVLDSLGAARDPEIRALCGVIGEFGSGKSHQAAVWGYGRTLNMSDALLLNGMMGHALEMDDVHAGSKSHIGAVVVPAAWTCGEALGASGHQVMEAVIVGYEVMGRVGIAMDVVSNRKRGWHTTGVIGTFGAAAAVGKLLGLDIKQMISALGMAGTQSSGLWAFLGEGVSCKKLHPARAAVNGATAALLAKGGMTGPEHILDAEDGGLYRAVSDRFQMDLLCRGLGEEFEILKMDKKPYPCCRTTHHAIDGALELGNQIKPGEIDHILVETYSVGVLQCGSPVYPVNPGQAKFSIPYTVAAAFVCGQVTEEEFAMGILEDGEIQRLARSVEVRESPVFTERYPKRWGCRMTVFLKDGREDSIQVDDMSGSVGRPLSKKQELDKFHSLTRQVLPVEGREGLIQAVLHMEELKSLPNL